MATFGLQKVSPSYESYKQRFHKFHTGHLKINIVEGSSQNYLPRVSSQSRPLEHTFAGPAKITKTPAEVQPKA